MDVTALFILILVITGFALSLAGSVWFLVAAFKESVFWGIALLLFPLTSLFFLIIHWREAGKPFALSCLGFGLIVIAQFIGSAAGQ